MPKPVHPKAQRAAMEFKSFRSADFKVSDPEQGIVEAVVSVFNNEDYGGDIVRRGFFADSLQKKLPPGVWMHDWTMPVAKTLEATELAPGDPRLPAAISQNGGLYVKGQFNLETQRGKEAFSDIKKGIIDEFSFGYLVQDAKFLDGGTRELLKGEIFEWSPVLVGMNPATAVLSAKARQATTQKDGYQPEPYHQDADEVIVCPQCSKHNDDDARFCDQCGFELQGADGVRIQDENGKSREEPEVKAALPIHHTPVDDGSWDGPAAEKALPNDGDAADYKKAFAWVDADKDPDTKAAYKFIHHEVGEDGKVGAANKAACSAGIGALNGGRGGTTIPEADRKGVWAHLAAHLKDAGVEEADIPPLKSRTTAGLKLAEHVQAVLDAAAVARDANADLASSTNSLTERAKSIHELRQKDGRVLSAASLVVLGDLSGDLEDALGILTDARDDLQDFLDGVTSGSGDASDDDNAGTQDDDAGKSALAMRTLMARTQLASQLLAHTN